MRNAIAGLATALIVLAAMSPRARAEGEALTPWLGVGIEYGPVGVRIGEVVADTPAAVAGLELGDQIVAIDGVAVRAPDQLIDAIGAREVGDRVVLEIVPAGEATRVRTELELSARLDEVELIARRLEGRPAPAFHLPVVQGAVSGSLADHRGTIVVLEFFAPTCKACKGTFQPLAELAAANPNEVVVLAIGAGSPARLRAFLDSHPVAVPVLADDGGLTRTRYRSGRTPTLVVVGRDGVVRFAGIGAGPNLEAAIRATERAVRER